jgi:histone H3/H4
MSSDEEETEEVAAEEVAEEGTEVSAAVVDGDDEGEEVVVEASVEDDDEVMTVKSELTNDDDESKRSSKGGGKRKRGGPPPGSRKGRTPAVQGLAIPFRAIKRTMKMDPDIGTVQNEAAIMTTLAAELFVKNLASQSHQNAKNKGRNTIRYEDVAEARTKDPALTFLETLIP